MSSNDFLEFVREFPETASTIILLLGGGIGWGLRNLVQFFLDRAKYKKELNVVQSIFKAKMKSEVQHAL